MIFVIAFMALVAFIGVAGESYYERSWPRRTIIPAAIMAALLFFGASAFGQAYRYDSNITTPAKNTPPGAQAPIYTMPYANVYVCGYPATPSGSLCTNRVPVYSDQGLTTPIAQPVMADGLGAFGFWVAPGFYTYSVQSSAGAYVGTYTISLIGVGPAGPTGPGGTTTATGTNGNFLVPGAIHALNADIPAIDNIGDSITWGQGVGSAGGTAGGPGVLGTSTDPVAYAWKLQAAYGGGGQNVGYPGDEAADQTSREYAALSTPPTSGSHATTIMLGTNDAALCGTSAGCQSVFTQSILFIGSDRAIPATSRIKAGSCTAPSWTSDTSFPFGMITSTAGATMTCALITAGKPIYSMWKQASGVFSMTVDGIACPSVGPTNYAGTGNNAPNAMGASRCSNSATANSGSHVVVYTNTSGTNEIVGLGSAPAVDNTILGVPKVYIAGVPWDQNDGHEPGTGIYNSLALSTAAQLAADGLNVVPVDIRAYLDANLGYNGGTVGNVTYAASNALPYHPGPLGHLQIYNAFIAKMQPLTRSAQAFQLYGGSHGYINGNESTSGVYSTDSNIKTILSIGSSLTTSSQAALDFPIPGTNSIYAIHFGAGPAFANSFAIFDLTNQVFPFLVPPDGSTCLQASISGGGSLLGCPGAGFYLKAGSQGTGVQSLFGTALNPGVEACTYGASPCTAGAHVKIQAPAGANSTFEATGNGGGSPQFLLYNASAPTGNRVWVSKVLTDGLYRQQFCTDTTSSCSDAFTFNPVTSTLATPSISTSTLTTGTTCTVGGFVTLVVDGVTRKIAYCN